MKRKRNLLILSSVVLFGALALLSIVAVSVPEISWRLRAMGLHISGDISDISFAELVSMLRPGSPFYLESIVTTKSPYQSVQNPFTTGRDLDAGEAQFQNECSGCHGVAGIGGAYAPALTGNLQRGNSDWALFRNISRGIAGTPMAGRGDDSQANWQLVAYLRSLDTNVYEESDFARESSPVSPERLVSEEHPSGDWLIHSGSYNGHRFSALNEIDRSNVFQLQLRWTRDLNEIEIETVPLVNDGVMYLTKSDPNAVLAVNAANGKLIWNYERPVPPDALVCCTAANRGVALLHELVFLGTLDAHLVALDAKTGEVAWDVAVADYKQGYSITAAPLAIGDKVVTGVGGSGYGIRGLIDAYNAQTGEREWRFRTIPEPGEPGSDSWSEDSWKVGGAAPWNVGSYDADLNLLYWGVGNPAPLFQGEGRLGDNLYSDSVVALDFDTGELDWHFQFTPHDEHDWDSTQIPVLVDSVVDSQRRKLMLWANRNGFYYVLDRVSGEFLVGTPFVRQTWAKGLNQYGRPILVEDSAPTPRGTLTYPSVTGGTNWWPPSYSPITGLIYVPTLEKPGIFYKDLSEVPVALRDGKPFRGGGTHEVPGKPFYTAVRAINGTTGELVWERRSSERTNSEVMGGILSTAGNIVFFGDDESFYALDAEDGRMLWSVKLAGRVRAAPITYAIDESQYVTIAAGRNLYTFSLPQIGDQ